MTRIPGLAPAQHARAAHLLHQVERDLTELADLGADLEGAPGCDRVLALYRRVLVLRVRFQDRAPADLARLYAQAAAKDGRAPVVRLMREERLP